MKFLFSMLREWRDARQDIFDHDMSKINDENKTRWNRLSNAENDLMKISKELLDDEE